MRRFQLLWLLLGLALPAAPAAANGDLPPIGILPAIVENNLVFQRQGGEVISFPAGTQTWVWCGPFEEGNVATPTLHIWTYDPDVFFPGWKIDAILDDVTLENAFTFPNHWTWPNPDSVMGFVVDPPNEASTDTEESGGSIVFHALDCGSAGEVRFSIDATLGSEFGDGTPITVRGDFRASYTGPPAPVRETTWGSIKAIYR